MVSFRRIRAIEIASIREAELGPLKALVVGSEGGERG
jgi:hypothetical protein